jgi:hypothetical protein
MKRCVFLGPSAPLAVVPAGIDSFGPALSGSIYAAVKAGYRIIGLIDGMFGNTPSVWHKEILFAIHSGVEVIGGASMGALRASELWQYGMRGAGRIYRYYRSGAVVDDDEVCVTHAIREMDYSPISEAMINIRRTLRHLGRNGVLGPDQQHRLCMAMKALHFSERDMEALERIAEDLLPAAQVATFMREFKADYVDVKALDAIAVVDQVAAAARTGGLARPAAARLDAVDWTGWSEQFERSYLSFDKALDPRER